MSFNLIRNSRVFFTSNVDTTGIVLATGFTPTNTFEIQVLDGFSFSQNTSSETVTINEAGAAPIRGQRSFNTALDPVDFSMSTYIRPRVDTTTITAEECVLWNALGGVDALSGTNPAWTDGSTTGPVAAQLDFTYSNVHQLQKFGMIIVVDGICYVIDNAALDTATLDFGIDAIGMVAWAGKGTALRQIAGVTVTEGATVTFANGLTGTGKGKITTARYITNKLSTLALEANISGGGTAYTIAITGGSITISNNLTYLTPANLGTVNQPIGYFTGTRSITGSVNAYLRTGAGLSASLLTDMLAAASSSSETKYKLVVAMGGSTNSNRVDLEMNGAMLTIPTLTTDQVVSTTVNFTAQPYTGSNYDLTATNELVVKYFATA